jgi:hypothetical protein
VDLMRRILLCGPPLAGKTTMLQAFAGARTLTLWQFDPLGGGGKTEGVVDRGLYVKDPEEDATIATIWGAFWYEESWPTLVARADGIVLVLDPQIAREKADREFVAAVSATAPRLGCTVWTKGDLVARGSETVDAGAVLATTLVESWPVFTTRFDDASTLLAPLHWILTATRGT